MACKDFIKKVDLFLRIKPNLKCSAYSLSPADRLANEFTLYLNEISSGVDVKNKLYNLILETHVFYSKDKLKFGELGDKVETIIKEVEPYARFIGYNANELLDASIALTAIENELHEINLSSLDTEGQAFLQSIQKQVSQYKKELTAAIRKLLQINKNEEDKFSLRQHFIDNIEKAISACAQDGVNLTPTNIKTHLIKQDLQTQLGTHLIDDTLDQIPQVIEDNKQKTTTKILLTNYLVQHGEDQDKKEFNSHGNILPNWWNSTWHYLSIGARYLFKRPTAVEKDYLRANANAAVRLKNNIIHDQHIELIASGMFHSFTQHDADLSQIIAQLDTGVYQNFSSMQVLFADLKHIADQLKTPIRLRSISDQNILNNLHDKKSLYTFTEIQQKTQQLPLELQYKNFYVVYKLLNEPGFFEGVVNNNNLQVAAQIAQKEWEALSPFALIGHDRFPEVFDRLNLIEIFMQAAQNEINTYSWLPEKGITYLFGITAEQFKDYKQLIQNLNDFVKKQKADIVDFLIKKISYLLDHSISLSSPEDKQFPDNIMYLYIYRYFQNTQIFSLNEETFNKIPKFDMSSKDVMALIELIRQHGNAEQITKLNLLLKEKTQDNMEVTSYPGQFRIYDENLDFSAIAITTSPSDTHETDTEPFSESPPLASHPSAQIEAHNKRQITQIENALSKIPDPNALTLPLDSLEESWHGQPQVLSPPPEHNPQDKKLEEITKSLIKSSAVLAPPNLITLASERKRLDELKDAIKLQQTQLEQIKQEWHLLPRQHYLIQLQEAIDARKSQYGMEIQLFQKFEAAQNYLPLATTNNQTLREWQRVSSQQIAELVTNNPALNDLATQYQQLLTRTYEEEFKKFLPPLLPTFTEELKKIVALKNPAQLAKKIFSDLWQDWFNPAHFNSRRQAHINHIKNNSLPNDIKQKIKRVQHNDGRIYLPTPIHHILNEFEGMNSTSSDDFISRRLKNIAAIATLEIDNEKNSDNENAYYQQITQIINVKESLNAILTDLTQNFLNSPKVWVGGEPIKLASGEDKIVPKHIKAIYEKLTADRNILSDEKKLKHILKIAHDADHAFGLHLFRHKDTAAFYHNIADLLVLNNKLYDNNMGNKFVTKPAQRRF